MATRIITRSDHATVRLRNLFNELDSLRRGQQSSFTQGELVELEIAAENIGRVLLSIDMNPGPVTEMCTR
jgi:hypothetical protein